MPFSVVMSVYEYDNPEHFSTAFKSLVNQTLPPDQIIITIDGPVGADLEKAIDSVQRSSLVSLIRLPINSGLGYARHVAILACRNNLIAVMDSDDICAPSRFFLQLEAFKNSTVDLVGGYIEEFENYPGDRPFIRAVPLSHKGILRRGRWRQPFNHVTIMFKRDMYLEVGGYRPIRFVEDFDLFHRMFVGNVRFLNLPDILVYVRGGQSVVGRRRGFSYLKAEIALFVRMYNSSFIGLTQLMFNILTRLAVRLMPEKIITLVYSSLLRVRVSVGSK